MSSFTPTTICVVLASLAGAGTAGADVHLNPDGHGGRSHPAVTAAAAATSAVTLGGVSHQGQPVVADVSRNRRTIVLNAAYVAPCAAGSSGSSTTKFAPATVKKNGRYSIARTIRMRFDDGYTLVESYKAKGRVTKRGATGSLSITDVWYTPQGAHEDTCATGAQSYRLFDAGTFAGTTDSGDPVVLEHSPGRDRITSMLIPWTAECRSGNRMWGTASVAGPVAATGAFGGTLTQDVDLGDGRTAHQTQVLDGSMLARRVVGTWNVTASVVDANQTETDSCNSGVVSFKLK
jgi:hypothetical protein